MNVLLTGTYSAHNKGDLAMQLTAAELFQQRDVSVSAALPFLENDEPTYVQAGISVTASNRRKLVRASWQIMRLVVWRMFGRRPSWIVRDRSLDPFRSADVVVDLSGDMLTEDYGPHVAYSHFLPLLKALLLGRKLVILAQSIGPFRFTKPLATAILRRADLITVRDPVSERYLVDLGLGHRQLTADLAFAMEPATAPAVQGYWDELGLDEAPILGVSVSQLVASHHKRRGQGDFYSHLATALDRFVSEQGAQVLFVPHVTGPATSKDDRVAAREVSSRMSAPSAAIEADLSPQELKALIAKTTWFIGCRMHANIAALSSKVPVAAIAYSHKTPGIMSRLGLDRFVLDVAELTADSVSALLSGVCQESEDIVSTLRQNLGDLEDAAHGNIDSVLSILEGSSL